VYEVSPGLRDYSGVQKKRPFRCVPPLRRVPNVSRTAGVYGGVTATGNSAKNANFCAWGTL
jgi:hypothetical protein